MLRADIERLFDEIERLGKASGDWCLEAMRLGHERDAAVARAEQAETAMKEATEDCLDAVARTERAMAVLTAEGKAAAAEQRAEQAERVVVAVDATLSLGACLDEGDIWRMRELCKEVIEGGLETIDELRRQRDEFHEWYLGTIADLFTTEAERDAAIKRAEKAEGFLKHADERWDAWKKRAEQAEDALLAVVEAQARAMAVVEAARAWHRGYPDDVFCSLCSAVAAYDAEAQP